VARWVVQHAPVHPLAEVQEGLREGRFFTFLALTPAEVAEVRSAIQGLGLPSAAVTLAPAAGLESLGRPGGRTPGRARAGLARGQWIVFGLAAGGMALAALAALRFLGGRGF
jgi:hypothetical protein